MEPSSSSSQPPTAPTDAADMELERVLDIYNPRWGGSRRRIDDFLWEEDDEPRSAPPLEALASIHLGQEEADARQRASPVTVGQMAKEVAEEAGIQTGELVGPRWWHESRPVAPPPAPVHTSSLSFARPRTGSDAIANIMGHRVLPKVWLGGALAWFPRDGVKPIQAVNIAFDEMSMAVALTHLPAQLFDSYHSREFHQLDPMLEADTWHARYHIEFGQGVPPSSAVAAEMDQLTSPSGQPTSLDSLSAAVMQILTRHFFGNTKGPIVVSSNSEDVCELRITWEGCPCKDAHRATGHKWHRLGAARVIAYALQLA